MKALKTKVTGLVAMCLLTVASCKKVDTNQLPPNSSSGNKDVDTLVAINAPESFNYNTDKNITIDVTVLAPDNTPVKNIPVRILNLPEEMGGSVLFKGMTDQSGKITGEIKLPAYIDRIVVDPRYLGVMRNATVSIVSNAISCTLGGVNDFEGNVTITNTLGGKTCTGSKPCKAACCLFLHGNLWQPG